MKFCKALILVIIINALFFTSACQKDTAEQPKEDIQTAQQANIDKLKTLPYMAFTSEKIDSKLSACSADIWGNWCRACHRPLSDSHGFRPH